MPAKGSKKKRGPRLTKPKSRVCDLRHDQAHDDSLLVGVRRAAAAGRLDLGGMEQASIAPGLAQLGYACDCPELTRFGGVVPFAQFANAAGLADVAAEIPMGKNSSTYGAGKVAETIVMLLAAGLSRVSHIDDVTHDPGLCTALGLERLPDQSTLSRFFSEATDNAVQYLRAANRRMSEAIITSMGKQKRLVVDSDTRIVGVYGKQEGTVRSRRNGGQPHFTFEVTSLRNTYDILDAGLLRGATHPVPLFLERFSTVVQQLAPHTDELDFCADAAWYASSVFQAIEAADADPTVPCACKYVIRVQINDRHRHAIAAIDEQDWKPCTEGVEIAEYRLDLPASRAGADTTMRRHIVTRQPKPPKSSKSQQPALMDVPEYEYGALITNLSWNHKAILRLYNDRTTIESILRENALGFNMDSLPSACFVGNQVFSQLLVLSYNLTNLFRRLCLPKDRSRHHVPCLRRILLAIPALVLKTDNGALLRFATKGPHVALLATVFERLRRWVPVPQPEPPPPVAT